MEKLNIAELLKDCPRGMELNCAIYEDVHFEYVDESQIIHCYIQREFCKTSIIFHKYGTLNSDIKSKCVIFPKGRTTWGDFIPPYQFKDGDVLTYMLWNKPTIYIYRENGGYTTSYYAAYSTENKKFYCIQTGALAGNRNDLRFATEEEKQKLFDVIKENGYKWNPETKTLEKLIETKFKKGDKVRVKNGVSEPRIIKDVCDTFYALFPIGKMDFTDQDNWELVPNKFNITTLKPFESRVLVRDLYSQDWKPAIYGYKKFSLYTIVGGNYPYCQCIPYEGNEHLLGTTDDCDDYYKTWK